MEAQKQNYTTQHLFRGVSLHLAPTPRKEINSLLTGVLSHFSLDSVIGTSRIASWLPIELSIRQSGNPLDFGRQIAGFSLFKEELNVT